MNIKTLAKKVNREATPDEYDELTIWFGREDLSDNFDSLRRSTKIQLKQLQADLNRLIPNDFDYRIYFEEYQIDGQLIYMDGENAGVGSGFPVDMHGDYVKELRNFDWDKYRAWAIPGANVQDNAAEIAKEMQGSLPSTATAQFEHSEAFNSFVLKAEQEKLVYGILVYNDSLDEYEESFRTNRDHLVGDVYDFLAFRWPIIAIVDEGKLLSVEDIEKFKLEQFEGLGPISKSKALGNFGASMNMIM